MNQTSTLLTASSLPAIIRNDDGFYEGDLVHYFRIFFMEAQNLFAPYHNFRHDMHTFYLCYRAYVYYRDRISPSRGRALLIGSMFHDFDHPGMRGDDDLNVTRAIRGMHRYLLPRDAPIKNEIETIMRTTEFPHRPMEISSLPIAIIRDADMAQCFSEAWLQQVVFGLAAEWRRPPLEVLREEEKFIRGIRFTTEWARTLFPQEAINAKADEAAELAALLS